MAGDAFLGVGRCVRRFWENSYGVSWRVDRYMSGDVSET